MGAFELEGRVAGVIEPGSRVELVHPVTGLTALDLSRRELACVGVGVAGGAGLCPSSIQRSGASRPRRAAAPRARTIHALVTGQARLGAMRALERETELRMRARVHRRGPEGRGGCGRRCRPCRAVGADPGDTPALPLVHPEDGPVSGPMTRTAPRRWHAAHRAQTELGVSRGRKARRGPALTVCRRRTHRRYGGDLALVRLRMAAAAARKRSAHAARLDVPGLACPARGRRRTRRSRAPFEGVRRGPDASSVNVARLESPTV